MTLELEEFLLRTLADLDPGYVAVHVLFRNDANAPLRANPRFIRFMQCKGVFPLWRALVPPPDCHAAGDRFICGHRYPTVEIKP